MPDSIQKMSELNAAIRIWTIILIGMQKSFIYCTIKRFYFKLIRLWFVCAVDSNWWIFLFHIDQSWRSHKQKKIHILKSNGWRAYIHRIRKGWIHFKTHAQYQYIEVKRGIYAIRKSKGRKVISEILIDVVKVCSKKKFSIGFHVVLFCVCLFAWFICLKRNCKKYEMMNENEWYGMAWHGKNCIH